MDPQELGLTYIQGASTDSGIDTPPVATPPTPQLSVGEEEGRCLEGYCKVAAPDRVVAQGVAQATASGHPRDGSLGNLSESSSQSR
jgi:signal-induced proliferation-associated 1 like protein 2